MCSNFLDIVDYLYKVNATFGVDHIVIGNKVYWLDSLIDREKLMKKFLKDKGE